CGAPTPSWSRAHFWAVISSWSAPAPITSAQLSLTWNPRMRSFTMKTASPSPRGPSPCAGVIAVFPPKCSAAGRTIKHLRIEGSIRNRERKQATRSQQVTEDKPFPRKRSTRLWVAGILVLTLAAPALPEVLRVTLGPNFHTVIEQRFFRAAQPSGATLETYIRDYGIRTVINLRGPN